MGIRVRAYGPVDQTPELAGALVPVPAAEAQAWSSRGPVVGGPAYTRPAPAPLPGLDGEPIAYANSGYIGLPSSRVPQEWRAQAYWTQDLPGAPLERPPVTYLRSSHELPVPALIPANVTGQQARPAVQTPGTGRQVAWPRVSIRWPSFGGEA